MDGHCLAEPASDGRQGTRGESRPSSLAPHPRALVVSSICTAHEMGARIGREAYSYRFVFDAFAPLLGRWGRTIEVTQAESRLDYALWRARQQHLEPVHLSFLPLHLTYLTRRAPNVAFPFWEFPDIPNRTFDNNPRNNWVHVADHLDLIVTASRFTRDAFVRAGVRTPIKVVPVPIAAEYFSTPAWQPGQRTVIESPCYVFPQLEKSAVGPSNPWAPLDIRGLSLRARARFVYKSYIAPRMPARLDKYLTVAARTLSAVRRARADDVRVPYPVCERLDLSGVVYTTILNPFDPRKNWQDLLSAFLLGLAGCDDATLVVKLAVPPRLAATALNGMIAHYQDLGLSHRCRLVFVTSYLSEPQMVELAQASTYYVNAARAEGSCLPLQHFLAAGRPGIAPGHTALADYFNADLGFVVASDWEPAVWPHDPEKRISTRWHRLVWQSLHDAFQASYQVAKNNRSRYQRLAEQGKERMAEFAGEERVWPRLAAALNAVADNWNWEANTARGQARLPWRQAS